ncbi:winged helix-turn-helix domain-containing protein [Paenibacillus sp. MMS20-IR301]|uniref:winged helix-turn-helix domain-containing protein n=1 Tax=Paenibacillus sp. MMS20-IR301 TaxID=2895946 RepID=UPI0028E9A6A8|nr:winged helix-turn-helix domain-containing protein [Paenibacillus sp. MMS20-IR301]WNS41128.1 winged helix-turn-helix domain-containing protein [Paenibacillus sp. MMS20-IR301]
MLELNESEYRVSAGGISITLLPKEFALLQFLYRNRGRTFSREQLLDKVWPLEYPVERTVDDHIYRLRKKLHKLGTVDIKTVRGFGYSLTVPDMPAGVAPNPTIQDPDLHEAMRGVFGKYHVYGQGKSMLTLARQQDLLGYELDPLYSVVVHYMQGDLDWLLYTEEVPLKDRLFYLILFYMFSGDPREKLGFCGRIIDNCQLPDPEQTEMEILIMLDLFTTAGETGRALERLNRSYQVIAGPGYENFVPVTMITEMYVHLTAGTGEEELIRMDEAIGRMLQEKPFLREIGSYKVVKGLWHFRRGQWLEGDRLLEEGMSVQEMSGFAPLRLYALYRIYHFCRVYPPAPPVHRKYIEKFTAELEQMGLNRLDQPLAAVLRQFAQPL